jgi:hypothetical protein
VESGQTNLISSLKLSKQKDEKAENPLGSTQKFAREKERERRKNFFFFSLSKRILAKNDIDDSGETGAMREALEKKETSMYICTYIPIPRPL